MFCQSSFAQQTCIRTVDLDFPVRITIHERLLPGLCWRLLHADLVRPTIMPSASDEAIKAILGEEVHLGTGDSLQPGDS